MSQHSSEVEKKCSDNLSKEQKFLDSAAQDAKQAKNALLTR